MELKHDPYQIFRDSKTPAGLYARQKWLDEEKDDAWQANFDNMVDSLYADQGADGSWGGSPGETVERLFGLHLTVRHPDARIMKAMAWLLARIHSPITEIVPPPPSDRITLLGEWKNLPFMAEGSNLWTAAALFLAGIFGMERDPEVLEAYSSLAEEGIASKGRWNDVASASNALRALVVHPLYSNDLAVTLAVESLAERQLPDGRWPSPIPFYQTLNALAHLNLPHVDEQLSRAFTYLLENQRPDGSWGDDQTEWNTFLAVHALLNRGLLRVSDAENRNEKRKDEFRS